MCYSYQDRQMEEEARRKAWEQEQRRRREDWAKREVKERAEDEERELVSINEVPQNLIIRDPDRGPGPRRARDRTRWIGMKRSDTRGDREGACVPGAWHPLRD